MTLDGLVTITANLRDGYNQLDPNTFQTSSELTAERRTNTDLRDRWFYTANVSLYAVEDNEAVFYFGQRDAFNAVIGNNIDKVTEQLISTGNYRPKKEDLEVAKDIESTIRVNISKLELKGDVGDWGYFEIDTKNYDALSQEQRRVAEAVYGAGNDFIENMQMLNADGISVTRIYVLKEGYVKQNAKESPIALAGGLGCFGLSSYFFAGEACVDDHLAWRGVRKVQNVAEGDAQKKQ